MALGSNLMRLRRLKSWTQGQLSDATGIKIGHISKLERDDDTDPKLSTIYKLMNALGCSADDLLMDKDRVGPSGRLQGAFKRAEELPEERQEIILHLVETYCTAYGLEKILGDQVVIPLPGLLQRKSKPAP